VVVEIAGRLIAGLGDLTHRSCAIALGREEIERHLLHLGGGNLRPFGLASVGFYKPNVRFVSYASNRELSRAHPSPCPMGDGC
jgi:hypothetical protein